LSGNEHQKKRGYSFYFTLSLWRNHPTSRNSLRLYNQLKFLIKRYTIKYHHWAKSIRIDKEELKSEITFRIFKIADTISLNGESEEVERKFIQRLKTGIRKWLKRETKRKQREKEIDLNFIAYTERAPPDIYLNRIIMTLNPEEKKLLQLFLSGYNLKEIAKQLKKTHTSIRQKLVRLKKKLKTD